ncbi:hypothetical protein E2320_014774, partial [Naja naja]
MNPMNTLWCLEEADCIPCVQPPLALGAKQDGGANKIREQPKEHPKKPPLALGAKQDGGANKIREQPKEHPKKIPRTHIFLMAETYSSTPRCVEVEVWLPYDWE